MAQAVGAVTPIDDLGLVDVKAMVVASGKAGTVTDGAVDVLDATTLTADYVMVVVVYAGFVAGRRTRRLNPAQQAKVAERVHGVVHRLPRHRADRIAHIG